MIGFRADAEKQGIVFVDRLTNMPRIQMNVRHLLRAFEHAHRTIQNRLGNIDRFRRLLLALWNWEHRRRYFLPNDSDQPRGPSENGDSDADESPEDGRLPALRCGGWLGSLALNRLLMSESPIGNFRGRI